MENWLNKVTYGNLSDYYLDIYKTNCIADAVIPILDEKYGSKLNFPLNNSETVKQELNDMVQMVSSANDESNSDHLRRYIRYDRNLLQSIISAFTTKGIDVTEICNSVYEDVTPAIVKLKQKYQRPRPYQLAQYYKLKLFPYNTKSGHTPSYPSGHTIQSYIILNIIGNKHPQAYGFCKKFIEDIALSRVYLGLHYPSDNDASFIIAQEIMKLKPIIEKYKI